MGALKTVLSARWAAAQGIMALLIEPSGIFEMRKYKTTVGKKHRNMPARE